VASALQCPACGYKHRLSGLSGEPVFPCAHCGRLLKTPTEYRRPEPSGPAEAPRPSSSARVQRGGSARRDQTSVLPAPPGGAPRPPARRTPMRRASVNLALPLRILAWVAAVFLSALIVRWFAKVTGLVTGDSIIDVITGSGFGRYLRLFALVPIWALFAAGLATLFIEGGRWWMLRRRGVTGRPPSASRPTRNIKVPAAAGAAKSRAPKPAPAARKVPKRAPEPEPQPVAEREPVPEREPTPAPARQPAPRPVVPNPAASETRSPTGAAGAPRPRRIPRRDVSS